MTIFEHIDLPEFGSPLPAARASVDTHRLLRLRRSTPADKLVEPGPDEASLNEILRIGARVPDHRCVAPFRFIVFRGDARSRAGRIICDAFSATNPEMDDGKNELEARRFERAPIVIAVISSVDTNNRTPEWEQILTVGAVCYNILLAAYSLGFAAQWLTEWYAYDEKVKEGFGLSQHERFAGFLYVGTASEDPLERRRPEIEALVRYF